MMAYMDLNGIPATGNRWLLDELLRDAWGFEGFVVSDANAVRNLVTHGFAADLTDAGARAVNAGLDLEMAVADPAYDHLPEALASGAVDEEALDASVRRVLEAKFRMGLFDDPYVDEDLAREVLADPDHRVVAGVAAERSAVLLRNEGELLPLDAGSLGSIAVIGPLADSARDTIGPWCFDFDLDETVTVLDGIRARAGDTVRVDYAHGRSGRYSGLPVDVRHVRPVTRRRIPSGFDEDAEFAAGGRAGAGFRRRGRGGRRVAEHDRRDRLPVVPRAARPAARTAPGGRRATGTPVVLLVMNGRPLDLRWAAEQRAGDPGHLVSRAPRVARRSPTCCSATSRRAASCPSAGRGPSARCR